MFFFRLMTLLLGVVMVSLAPFFLILYERFKIVMFRNIYPEKRPVWMWVPIAGISVLAVLSWYVEITTRISFSWLVTLFLTMGLAKALILIFRYDELRSLVEKMSRYERSFKWGLGIFVYLVGILLLTVGIFALK